MRARAPERGGAAAALLAAALLLTAPPALAQRLPFRHYGVRDGLAHDRVTTLHADGQGYLWLGTVEGLSRFDGYRFVSYGAADGFEHRIVNAVTEDRQGRVWVATNGAGVARLLDDPAEGRTGAKKFRRYSVGAGFADRVNALVFDAEDTLWCATDLGLYRAPRGEGDARTFERVEPFGPGAYNMAALVDAAGRVWLSLVQELFQFTAGARQRYSFPAPIRSLAQGPGGQVWLATERGLYRFAAPAGAGGRGEWQGVGVELGPAQKLLALHVDSAGAVWLGTNQGLVKLGVDGMTRRQTTYTVAQGLSDNHVRDVREDREGNLWIATWLGGVNVLSGEGIVSYTASEGLADPNVLAVVRDRAGRIYAHTERGGVAQVVDGRARVIPGSERLTGADSVQLRQDSRGDWWLGTHQGLFLLPGPELRPERARRLGPAEGIPPGTRFQGHLSGIYEDPSGVLWCAGTAAVYRLDPARARPPRFERLPLSPPFVEGDVVRNMATDPQGRLWLATSRNIGRLVDGRLELLPVEPGQPLLQGGSLFFDRRGWLWVGRRAQGLSLSRDPLAERPSFQHYSTADGLASDSVSAVTEDAEGRMWVATGRGLDQLDPATGQVRHFTRADGLAGDLVHHLDWDGEGRLWAATAGGLARLRPGHERRGRPVAPLAYLTRIRVAGEERPLPERGAREAGPAQLSAGQDNLLVEYVALSFFTGRPLRYEYRLYGLDGVWSAPTEMTAVHYARLPPGSYRFAVRALTTDGLVSPQEATFAFRLPPPVWRRWWFLGGAAAALVGLVAAAHRARVRRLLALEAIRRQIATDLHDEMGAGLSQVAILSEVARRDAPAASGDLLGEIAQLARDMRESMADIVWSIDPRKDRLEDLVRRMRQLAFNLLERDGLRVEFVAPPDQELGGIVLSPDRRRHLLLVFKEAIHNVARHARATVVRVRLDLRPGALRLSVEDNGRGFDPEAARDGHGLGSLRDRAAQLSGNLHLTSQPGHGTVLTVDCRL
jgi:ligand-binding sensor domain-containing protein/signal transduction histidine kinase